MSLEATATGNLQTTPFGHLLVYLLDRGLTGSLVLEEATGEKHAVWFEAGAPAKVKTATAVTYLGQVLVEQRAITREVYERTVQGALHTRRLHGEVLLETGSVDERVLRDALREQLARQVLWLFKLAPTTVYGYYDQVNLLERWGAPEGVRVRPLALIWRGLRRHASPAEIDAVTARLGDRPIELHIDAPIRRFRFEAAEQSLIDVLRAKPQPLASLMASGLASPDEVKRLVYALLILRQLELGVPGAEPVGVDEAPSSSRMSAARSHTPTAMRADARASVPDVEQVVPRPSSPQVSAAIPSRPTPMPASGPASPRASALPPGVRRIASPAGGQPAAGTAELRFELDAIISRLDGTHYELLGIPQGASVSVIQNAFFGLAKKWHPDRLRPELGDLKDEAMRVFARISHASQVLSDPATREAYDDALKGGGSADEAEQVQKILKASNAFLKAEVLLKRGNLALAEKEAQIAFENDPTQADHVAVHVWIQAQKPGADLTALAVELEKAVKSEPNNLRVRWYRGQLLKRLGRLRDALHDFRFIIERDPRHTDAHREVRLYAMRRGNRPPSDPPRTDSQPASGPASRGGRTSSSSGKSGSPPPNKPGLLNKLFKKS